MAIFHGYVSHNQRVYHTELYPKISIDDTSIIGEKSQFLCPKNIPILACFSPTSRSSRYLDGKTSTPATDGYRLSLPLTMKAGIFGNFSPKRPIRKGSCPKKRPS